MAVNPHRARSTVLSALEAASAPPESIGGKAAGLVLLDGIGGEVRVPPWCVVPASALGDALRRSGRLEHVSAALAGPELRQVPAELRDIVARLPLDEAMLGIAAEAVALVGDGPLAVRSSAVGEDSGDHSFAGQFETVLGVVGVEGVVEAIRRCWASAFGEAALSYRAAHASLAHASEMAVIVQRLVHGDRSGVIFTSDPVSGDRARMHISACLGLGDRLVSGEIDADELTVGRDGRILQNRAADGGGIVCITSADAAMLASAGRSIEAALGRPADIEFTIADGELYVLQARPITNLAPAATVRATSPSRATPPAGATPPGEARNRAMQRFATEPTAGAAGATATQHRIVWDNSNIQESFFGVTTPLTFSFASEAYAAVYEQTMRAVGIPERVIDEHRPLLRNLLGLIRGRVYYNLENWYRGLLLLPSFRRNKEDMERMMGVEEPVDLVLADSPGPFEMVRRSGAVLRATAGLARRFATLERDASRFLADFDATIRRIDRDSLGTRSLGELMATLAVLRIDAIERWTTPIVNDFAVMMHTGRLRRHVERAAHDDADRIMQTLLGGADVAVSAAPAMLLLAMADAIRRTPPAAHAIEHAQDDAGAALRTALERCHEAAAQYRTLIDRFGDRGMGELKLESRPMRDDPDFIVSMLRNYLAAPARDPRDLARGAASERDEVQRTVEKRLRPIARWRFRRALVASRTAIRRRETLRLARTRLFGAHRDVYRAIGARFAEAGALGSAEDVLYLTTDEIRAGWDDRATQAGFAETVRLRRAEFESYEAMDAPNRIVTVGLPAHGGFGHGTFASQPDIILPDAGTTPEAHSWTGDAASAGDGAGTGHSAGTGDRVATDDGTRASDSNAVLRGLGCSPGIAEGRVRVVSGPTDDLRIAGHVLVALRTDPGWSPLFPSAVAIVVERGSILSHSAVLARELGLPAVVSIPGVTKQLRDGELVRVDGTAGTVERLTVRE